MTPKYCCPTVIDTYSSPFVRSDKYESEYQLEKAMIEALGTVGYEFIDIHDSVGIMNNLRIQMDLLNETRFSDSEWNNILNNYLLRSNDSPVVSKTRRFQIDHRFTFTRDDGSLFNFKIIDKEDLGRNRLQVIHQYVAEDGKHPNRYDVSILCNGLPVVHVELKRRGVNIREAFNQIRRYGKESFWSGNRLFEYVQIFVISNGTITKYYSNSTRYNHISLQEGTLSAGVVTTCNSFEFTSFWTDSKNNHIEDLMDFSVTFLAKDTILKILTRYCVFNTEEQLLVMRPYQIAATEAIVSRALRSMESGTLSVPEAGGYIWHTTGSGKTLTSFKTAQLMQEMPEFDKIIFVVDRKDLDYQSMKEFQKFQEGAVNGSTNTRMLKQVLDDDSKRIVVTTIQKLNRFVSSYRSHPIYKKRVVMIFDECHRSQFGAMHEAITGAFKNYILFGFTGTPIFATNAVATYSIDGFKAPLTTKSRFGDCLHKYILVDAIRDDNVLRFKVDYVSTVRMKADTKDEMVEAIDTDTLLDPERLDKVVDYILANYDTKTHRREPYTLGDRRVFGFNSLFAVGSTQLAIKYYKIFKKKILENNLDLKVAVIYTFEDNQDFDGAEPSGDDDDIQGVFDAKAELEKAMEDYNHLFGETTNFSLSGKGFENYYKDVSDKMKNRQLDILIVVDMFLTGFDSKALNTLWVDRQFKYHGLIQAFSRTNRILNSVKDHGNIVCFRKMKKRVDEALALFADSEASGEVIMRPFDDYYYGFTVPGGKHTPGFKELVDELMSKFPLVGFRYETEDELYDFVKLFGSILRRYNLLMSFDDFTDDMRILTPGELQDYKSRYLSARDEVKRISARDRVSIRDDVVFEMELMYQNTISIAYMVNLIKDHDWGNSDDRAFKIDLEKKIGGDVKLRSKVSLIMAYINRVSDVSEGDVDWDQFVKQRMADELSRIIDENKLDKGRTEEFMRKALDNDVLSFDGKEFNDLLPPIPRFSKNIDRNAIVAKVEDQLRDFFELYQDTL